MFLDCQSSYFLQSAIYGHKNVAHQVNTPNIFMAHMKGGG